MATTGDRDRIASELGYICIHWGWVETALNDIIEFLAPLEPGQASQAITGNAEIRSKIQIVRALAFLRQPFKEWFDLMSSILDWIDSDLRPLRNNYVHSGWFAPKGRRTLRVRKTKFKKPQAFQLVLTTEEDIPIKLRELRRLRNDLFKAVRKLVFLLSSVMQTDERVSRAILAREFPRRARRRIQPGGHKKRPASTSL
jgi:hypothetical protein